MPLIFETSYIRQSTERASLKETDYNSLPQADLSVKDQTFNVSDYNTPHRLPETAILSV